MGFFSMNRYICIHGHFYQPPRENPWLEEIEHQDSAYPFKDWNERVSAECYAPNTASRILDGEGRITHILNNYSRISFNFGPTLLSWMEHHAPDVYAAILKADRESREMFGGHGSAIAQVYNHMIMPLANRRDKRTQILWGIRDFEKRFKRRPEGMWLAETAVDLETLDLLVEHGIKFTILSPYQAEKVRLKGSRDWVDASGGRIDPKKPYWCQLPSGERISLFFYDGPVAQDLAFGHLLKSGDNFAERLLHLFDDREPDVAQLVHVATDGETYGHHHKFANMALSYAIHRLENDPSVKLTVYGEFLEKVPPVDEVKVFQNKAWSCSHGVDRWQKDCSCNVMAPPGWNQKWRVGLREAMDWLRDHLAPIFKNEMLKYHPSGWDLRDQYIDLILDRSDENVERFFSAHGMAHLAVPDRIRVMKLLEMQRNAMLMYTSCGWFFNDISGIEPVQIMQYAACAIQLAEEIHGVALEQDYLNILETAVSNLPEMQNGREVYNRFVKPSVVSLRDVAANYAISLLFQDYPQDSKMYAYTAHCEQLDKKNIGKKQLITGRVAVRSKITLEHNDFDFVVLHLGDLNLNVGVLHHDNREEFAQGVRDVTNAFVLNDIPAAVEWIQKCFGLNQYSFWSLFKNEQSKAMHHVFRDTLYFVETNLRQIHDQYYPLMQVSRSVRAPLPKVLSMIVEYTLNRHLKEALECESPDIEQLRYLANELKRWSFTRNMESISLAASRRIDELMEMFEKNPEDVALLQKIETILHILHVLPLHLDLWKAQNIYFRLNSEIYRTSSRPLNLSAEEKIHWENLFNHLGHHLKVRMA